MSRECEFCGVYDAHKGLVCAARVERLTQEREAANALVSDVVDERDEANRQLAAVVEALEEGLADRFLHKGHTTVFCPNLDEPKPHEDDAEPCWECRTKPLLADIPAAVQRYAERAEKLAEALEKRVKLFLKRVLRVTKPYHENRHEPEAAETLFDIYEDAVMLRAALREKGK